MFEMLLADICTRALAALIPPPRDLCLDNGTAYRDQHNRRRRIADCNGIACSLGKSCFKCIIAMTSLAGRHIGMLVSWPGMLLVFLPVFFCLRVIAFSLMLSGHLHFKTRT